jgi:hypothetical protein
MSARYEYKGKNLTTLVLHKIELVAARLAEKENRNFEDCYKDFSESKTFKNLRDTETLLWAESAEFIVDDYERERGAGHVP